MYNCLICKNELVDISERKPEGSKYLMRALGYCKDCLEDRWSLPVERT